MNKEEVLTSRIKSKSVIKNDLFSKHLEKYLYDVGDNAPYKMGQFFLYEEVFDSRFRSNKPQDFELFYPKLGIYLNSLSCDQTIEIEWVDYRRTWECRVVYDYVNGLGMKMEGYIGDCETEIQRLPIWNDSLLVYGVWDSMPNWRVLRQAYEKTWWFHRTVDELRDLRLRLLI